MQFANPLFLFGFVALVIPIIVHLFNFRRYTRVWFTNVKLLSEISQETQKQSKIKQWLLLLTRILALSSLVLAFAQPFIPHHEKLLNTPGQHAVSIYIDNSMSMEAASSDGKLIDKARRKAIEIAAAYPPSDLFQLITNDLEGRHQHFVGREEFSRLVSEVSLTSATRSTAAIVTRMNDARTFGGKPPTDAYLISDFQIETTSVSNLKPDAAINWFMVPLKAEKRDNLFIDSAWFSTPLHQPGQVVNLVVRVKNSGSPLEKVPVKLLVNEVQKAVTSFNIGAESSVTIVLPYTENLSGIQTCQVIINDYPVVYDDRFFLAYPITDAIPILNIHAGTPNRYIDALFRDDSSFHFTQYNIKQPDYNNINNVSVVILDNPIEISSGLVEVITKFVRQGGTLVAFPPENGNPGPMNRLLASLESEPFGAIDTARQRVSTLRLESDLFADIFEKSPTNRSTLPDNTDLPVALKYYRTQSDKQSNEEVLMSLQDGTPFLVNHHAGQGEVFKFTTPLNESWSNFPRHMLYVPVMYKIGLMSSIQPRLYYNIGGADPITLPVDSAMTGEIVKLRNTATGIEIIAGLHSEGPSYALYPQDQVRDAGFYDVLMGKRPIARVAYNYNRKESDLRCFSYDELLEKSNNLKIPNLHVLKEQSRSITHQINQLRQGTPIWKWFIISTLLFLAAEIILTRLLKD